MCKHSISLALLATALLSGCSSQPPGSSAQDETRLCDASVVQQARGERLSMERVEQLQQQAGASLVRVLAPNEMATMEHNPQRLNIDIDDAEIIERLSCG
jgi:hypothetical protein